VINYNKAVR